MAETPHLKPGDIMGTTHDDSLLSTGIRWAQRQRGEGPSKWSHVGIIGNGGPVDEATVIEAAGTRIREVRIVDAYPAEARVAFFRSVNIPLDDLAGVVEDARADIGRRYPFGQLLLHLVDEKMLGGRRVLRRFTSLTGLVVCSGFGGVKFAGRGYAFGKYDPRTLTPDDISDWIESHPHHWQQLVPWAAFPVVERLAGPDLMLWSWAEQHYRKAVIR